MIIFNQIDIFTSKKFIHQKFHDDHSTLTVGLQCYF